MWRIAEAVAAVLAVSGVVWLLKKAWLRKHPEKEIAGLENRLLKNLREGKAGKALPDWYRLCNKVRQGLAESNPAMAQRGAEAIKLFVGEYFRTDMDNAKLNTAIYRELASLYAVSITQHPDLATEIVVALRVAAREIMERKKGVFDAIVGQFTLYGLLALREKKYYFAAKILDQIFLLVPKCFGKELADQQQSIIRAIGTLGQCVIKRQDNGLVREIVARLLQSREVAGRLIYEPIYDMLLKSVRVGAPEILDLLLESSNSVMAGEKEPVIKRTLHIWAEAAQNAAMQQDEAALAKIIAYMVRAAEDNLPEETITKVCLDGLFSVLNFAVRGKTVAEYGDLLFPVLELGCLCMQRELKYGLTDGAVKSYQGVLKYLLDKLLHLGAVVTRDGQMSTGTWVAHLYNRWTRIPDNAYRKTTLLKFMQLWLLYWTNCQRKTAQKQGGLPDELFGRQGWTPAELARFPNLYIRNL